MFLFHLFLSYLSLWNYSEIFLQDSTRYVDAQNCWNIITNGTVHNTLLIVSCSMYSFLSWVSETNQAVSSKIQPHIWMLKIVQIFQHFSKNFTPLKIFLVPRQCFLFFYLVPKEFIFLEQNQFLHLLKLVEILHQNFNFDFACRIIVPQWSRKKLLFI